jgi:tRNA(fMet)-specific endonuclease VapC
VRLTYWGKKKWQIIDIILDECILVEINENLVETYSQIDSYSQKKNPNFKDYSFATPRNTGKNDLWIAATASFLNLTLFTTDLDFDHLHSIFMDVRLISQSEIHDSYENF